MVNNTTTEQDQGRSTIKAFLLTLPILTKRRIQCGLFCPMGEFQSFTNKLNIFEVRIDPKKCVQCHRCMKICPIFSLDEKSVAKGKPRITCTKCGKCIDTCSKEAVSFHIKGTPLSLNYEKARLVFIYPAFPSLGEILALERQRIVRATLRRNSN